MRWEKVSFLGPLENGLKPLTSNNHVTHATMSSHKIVYKTLNVYKNTKFKI
jgi:hypothetical protein